MRCFVRKKRPTGLEVVQGSTPLAGNAKQDGSVLGDAVCGARIPPGLDTCMSTLDFVLRDTNSLDGRRLLPNGLCEVTRQTPMSSPDRSSHGLAQCYLITHCQGQITGKLNGVCPRLFPSSLLCPKHFARFGARHHASNIRTYCFQY